MDYASGYTSPTPRRTAMESAETLAAKYLARNATIDVGRCISRGINLVTGNLGLVVGSGLLAFAIAIGINLVPILGWIASFFVGPALVAGLIAALGVLALVIGLVVTAPIAGASLAVAYEDLFGDQKAEVVSGT